MGTRTTIRRISIHTSPKGGDRHYETHDPTPDDFNPHLPEGRRRFGFGNGLLQFRFQSTPPRREVTEAFRSWLKSNLFQSTPPRREVTAEAAKLSGHVQISIHTSPKGGDGCARPADVLPAYFNPHLPEGR